MHRITASWLATALVLASPSARAGDDAEGLAFFEAKIRPVIEQRCAKCHSATAKKLRAGLRLDSREGVLRGGDSGPAIEPGEPDDSLLIRVIEQTSEVASMPPGGKLPDATIADFRAWIARGAPDPRREEPATADESDVWWSLRPLADAEPPVLDPEHAAWPRNPIDAFILDHLARSGLEPAPEADRATLIRRLTFDLTGLPPTPEAIDAFVADPAEDAYERLVDRLLASPQYGVRWARRWLDLARFGESNGFEFDEFRPNAWPYRDWVVDALNRDLPYDAFARLQLAGDVLRPDDPSAIEATGFLVAGAYDTVGQTQQSQAMRKVVRQDELEDLVGVVGQTFLGLTVHCARCHDHKFDPIPQEDYYRLAAALSGVRHGERDLTDLDPQVQAARRAIDERFARIDAIEAPAVARLLADREPGATPPEPIARWDFGRSLDDRAGSLHGTAQGGARRGRDGLVVDGESGYVATAILTRDVTARTLEAWVQLDGLDQRGGAAISLQAADGSEFDAIVFGEREPGRWMAGSQRLARWQSFGGPEETEADDRPVHIAITFDDDGTIAAYRDGVPYGRPYRAAPPPTFQAGRAQILFGLRHGQPLAGRLLAGRIVRARLYDRALSAAEVAASAAVVVEPAEIAALLSPAEARERARLLAEVEALEATRREHSRKAYVVTPREPEPTHRLVRGNPAHPAELLSPGGVAAVAGPDADFGLEPDAPDADRRARLAAWITDPANPLFARVIVNRLWQGHFGRGIVETPSDFGLNGGDPSHPGLLDWLARDLKTHGWSLKAIHRRIVTSATYRQSSRPDPVAARVDVADRWLWRKAPVRLEAEEVRDAMLAVAGTLDARLGGPGFREFEVGRAAGTVTNRYTPIVAEGPEFDRRTLYRTWVRGYRNTFLDAFDCPDPSTTAPRRAVTTTPLQALALLNDALVLRLSAAFAERLRREAGDEPGRQVERAFRLALGRGPTDGERAKARRVVESFGAETLARALFNSNEFLYID